MMLIIMVGVSRLKEVFTKWNEYVGKHPQAVAYHRAEWLSIIAESYGHKPYFLAAYRENGGYNQTPGSLDNRRAEEGLKVESLAMNSRMDNRHLVGVLPLVAMKNIIFGRSLTSIPFFDVAGVLADDPECERMLVFEAKRIAAESQLDRLDLRHAEPMTWLEESASSGRERETGGGVVRAAVNKVRMVLELPDSAEKLMKSFKSKLRSQINKPLKEGLAYSCGGLDLLDEFYRVFLINMRDLGSPVHSKRLIQSVLENFPAESHIFIIRQNQKPVACSIVLKFKSTLWNPWASSLREYSALSPNMLLYWAMLEYACDRGFKFFDFGRSSLGEGTYRFKEQWGAKPKPLYWYVISSKEEHGDLGGDDDKKMGVAVEMWKKLPIPITRFLGPRIRKFISL
jgi:serine/alanine adding enzyme